MSKAQLKKATITVLDGADKGKVIGVLFNPTEYSFERTNSYKATPVPGLLRANTTQVYPEDRGTNYAVRLGEEAAREVLAG